MRIFLSILILFVLCPGRYAYSQVIEESHSVVRSPASDTTNQIPIHIEIDDVSVSSPFLHKKLQTAPSSVASLQNRDLLQKISDSHKYNIMKNDG